MQTTSNSKVSPSKANPYSFQKALDQVPSGMLRRVKSEIMEVLDIESRAGFLARVKGEIEPRVSEAKSIENIFKKYGITKIWG